MSGGSTVVFFCTLMAAAAADAQQPVVRVDVAPDTVNIGESVELTVTVLVPTWFARPPEYPDFELANAVTRLPPDSSYPTSERVGRDTWSGIVRKYRVTPLAGATYRMAGESIGVTWADPGAGANEAEVAVPEIVFRATVPAGAESLDPYLAGPGLEVDVAADGPVTGLEAGDAVLLRYSAALDGLPAIFLPPLAPEMAFDGVSVYRDAPVLADGPPARRTETVTLVFDGGGEFRVPEFSLDYWNTDSESVETATADGMRLEVAGPLPSPKTTASTVRGWRLPAVLMVLAAIAAWLSWRWVPRLGAVLAARAKRRRATEQHAFSELEHALARRDTRQAYREMVQWTSRLEPPLDSRQFALSYGDEELVAAVGELGRSLYGGGDGCDYAAVSARLRKARREYLAGRRNMHVAGLPPLNP